MMDIAIIFKLLGELRKVKKAEKKTLFNYLDIINNPEDYVAKTTIEGDEIVIRIKSRDKKGSK